MSNKYCIDCKHYETRVINEYNAATKSYKYEVICARTHISLISGEKVKINRYCGEERYIGSCGEKAKYFEAK